MKFERIGPTGLQRVGTMMTIGGMTNGRRAVMVNGEFRRHGGTMILEGIATGMGIPGNRVRNRVQVTTIGLMSKRLAVSAAFIV